MSRYKYNQAPPVNLDTLTFTQTPDKNEKERSRRAASHANRRFIAWDGEGMKINGEREPQNYVLYGNSAEIDTPLIKREGLNFFTLADYMLDVAKRHPNAYHVGYFFKYDQNMIIKGLPWKILERLYDKGSARVKGPDLSTYIISYIPKKKLRITKRPVVGKNSTILIEDFSSFFGSAFTVAYQSMFKDAESDPNFRKVIEGKARRASMLWDDLPIVLEYWRHEIIALERLITKFREIMVNGGFHLRNWYGPGVVANYIRRQYGLAQHEWGGKEENMPAEVIAASCSAYYGGRFESFRVGRIQGPIHSWDINSAYPTAFQYVPSLAEGGRWVHTDWTPTERRRMNPLDFRHGTHFAMYKVAMMIPNRHNKKYPNDPNPLALSPGPLPHRDSRGAVTYPTMLMGWYWQPEVSMLVSLFKLDTDAYKILERWEWLPAEDAEPYPWREVMQSMYAKRQALKRAGDPTQMAFKLGLNSLYGKTVQRVGWDEQARTPPKSHTLPIGGFLTSFCRAAVADILYGVATQDLISVDTDGVFFTGPPPGPRRAPEIIGDGLGEWSVAEYDEILYMQNGVYMLRQDDTWIPPKTRGIAKEALYKKDGTVNHELFGNHFATCVAGIRWEPLLLPDGEQFIGIGQAIGRSRDNEGIVNPFKASALHCRWYPSTKQIDLCMRGKRSHSPKKCLACYEGLNANEAGHNLVTKSRVWFEGPWSNPYYLPWHDEYVASEDGLEFEMETDTFVQESA